MAGGGGFSLGEGAEACAIIGMMAKQIRVKNAVKTTNLGLNLAACLCHIS